MIYKMANTSKIGVQGWGIKQIVLKCDRQALVVHAVYKSRMTTGVGQPPSSCVMNLMICEHDTRVKSAEIRLF